MEMFLMVMCMSLFGLGITAAAFGAATGGAQQEPEQQSDQVRVPVATVAARFFAEKTVVPPAPRPRVPIEALLAQIDNHVRLEQAAAESFLECPTAALLHTRTISPLVH